MYDVYNLHKRVSKLEKCVKDINDDIDTICDDIYGKDEYKDIDEYLNRDFSNAVVYLANLGVDTIVVPTHNNKTYEVSIKSI